MPKATQSKSAAQNIPLSQKITMVPTKVLKCAEYNPRKHDDVSKEQLKESFRRFGAVDPLIVNSSPKRKNIIIGGHFRKEVAEELGIKELPVVYVHIADIEKERELNLRLNRNTGEWDLELLKKFDIELLLDVGFDDSDLSDIWDDMLGTEDDEFDVEEELAKIDKPKTKLGDLYQLGSHRLLCGDATEMDNIRRLCGEQKINMVYTDIPYNINLDYSKGIGGKGNYGGTTDDHKTDDVYHDFVSSIIKSGLSVASVDSHFFVWCDQSYVWLLQQLYREHSITYKRTCLWIKNGANVTPQVAFNKAYEPCVYGIRGKPYLNTKATNYHEVLNKEVDSGNRTIDDIMDLMDVWLVKRLAGSEYSHPTEKSPTLHEKPLRRCTRPNDIVLDMTAGSGSTLIACEQMKRRAFLCEIEPIFCDLILHRYEELTGTKAILLQS